MNNKKTKLAWILFDVGNSAFGTIIVTAYFILYFKKIIVGDPSKGDFLWGLAIGLSMFSLAISAPFIGSFADLRNKRAFILRCFTILCLLATSCLLFSGPGSISLSILCFMVALFGYEGGFIFYDSFLQDVAPGKEAGKMSGYGFAAGYVGGILSLLLSAKFLSYASETGQWSLWPVGLVCLQFGLFAFPFLYLAQDPIKEIKPNHHTHIFQQAIKNLGENIRTLKDSKDLLLLLIAFLLYYDGVITLISFGASFAHDSFGFTPKQILIITLLANLLAIPGAISGGWMTEKIGGKPTIISSICLWMGTILLAGLTHSAKLFYVVILCAGFGLGHIQSATRALFSQFVPKHKEGQFFAFRGICGKFSSMVGPMLFGFISYATQNQRYAVLCLLIFFVLGLVLVIKIDEKRGLKLAQN